MRLEPLIAAEESEKAQNLVKQAEQLAIKCRKSFDQGRLDVLMEFHALKKQLILNDDVELSKLKSSDFASSDSKKLALCLIKAGRLDLMSGKLKSAREKALAAQNIEVTYSLFEDNPELLLEDINRVASRK